MVYYTRHLWISLAQRHRTRSSRQPMESAGTRGPYLIYHSIVADRRPTPHRIRLNIQLPERSRNDLFSPFTQCDRLTIFFRPTWMFKRESVKFHTSLLWLILCWKSKTVCFNTSMYTYVLRDTLTTLFRQVKFYKVL